MVELALEQTKLGHEVIVFSPEREAKHFLYRDVHIEGVPLRFRRPWRDYEFLWAAYRHLQRSPVDVLHFHGVPDGGRLANRLGCPSVLSFDYFKFRLSRSRLGWTYVQRGLRAFDSLLPVSAACARLAEEYWGPLNLEVLPNGVNLKQFQPDAEQRARFRQFMGTEEGSCVVLYVGRLCKQKGVDTLLDAWEELGTATEARLVMAGPVEQFGGVSDGALVDRLRSLRGLYLGPVVEDSLAAVYNACDIFVMPTRQDEMFGMAALEAQACGKPVIASDWGGLHESVSQRSGRFFVPGEPGQLAEALDELIRNRDRREEMGAEARLHASDFGWPDIARGAVSIYERAISARGQETANSQVAH